MKLHKQAQIPVEEAYKFCPSCAAANPENGRIPFRCQACGFAAFFGPVAAVGGLIINPSGLLLMVRRAREPGRGKWGLPGGFVDRGETVEHALKREVLEETGLRTHAAEYLMSYPNHYHYHGVIAPVIDFFFLCKVDAAQKIKIATDELEHFEWAEPNETHLANMAFESNRHAIERWLAVR